MTLGAGRAAALRRMVESSVATARAKTGGMTTGPGGFEVPEWGDVVVESPFRLGGSPRGGATSRRETFADGLEVQLGVRVGHFPAGTDALSDGVVVKVTAGENAGTFWRVVEGEWQDQATAYRVPLVQTPEPEGWEA